MNAIVNFTPVVVDEEIETIFEPVACHFVESLVNNYNNVVERMKQIHGNVTDPLSMAAMSHFFESASDLFTRYSPKPEDIFILDKALDSARSSFWQSALMQTELYDLMPQKRRAEWKEAIDNKITPAFDLRTVLETLNNLYAMRGNFLAERVEGVYLALSRNHVTNPAHGFYERMILEHAASTRFSYSINTWASGIVSDLINAIEVIETGDLASPIGTYSVLNDVHRRVGFGEWGEVQGKGVFVKFFKKGTIHIKVAEHIAWRLNSVLAMAMPNAISSDKRSRPMKATEPMFYSKNAISKEAQLVFSALAEKVFALVDSVYQAKIPHIKVLADKSVFDEVKRIVSYCGGHVSGEWVAFPYQPEGVLNELAHFAHLPGRQSHQYYPTPSDLADKLVAYAQINENDLVLEPSAGQGALAEKVGACASLDLVEVSTLHCQILEDKQLGTSLYKGDFLEFAKKAVSQNKRWDKILMNPPFAQGAYRAHIKAACNLLTNEGAIFAIVPSGVFSRIIVERDFEQVALSRHDGAFENTSIDVAMIKITRRKSSK